jgi:hypothetical protein
LVRWTCAVAGGRTSSKLSFSSNECAEEEVLGASTRAGSRRAGAYARAIRLDELSRVAPNEWGR